MCVCVLRVCVCYSLGDFGRSRWCSYIYNTTVHSLAYQNCIPPSTIHNTVQYSSSQEPYCGKDIGDRTLGCTLDRGSVATCNLEELKKEVPGDYRVSDSNSLSIVSECELVCVVVLICSIWMVILVAHWGLLITAHITGLVLPFIH